MPMHLRIAALLMLSAAAPPALGQIGVLRNITARDLLILCESTQPAHRAACATYIRSVSAQGSNVRWCVPTGTGEDQIRAGVARYLRANPDQLVLPYRSVLPIALMESFPCRR